MKDSCRFTSVNEVSEFVDSIPNNAELSWGRMYRDNDGYIRCEFVFADDPQLVSARREENRLHLKITDGIALVFLSILMFVLYFFVPSVPVSDAMICPEYVHSLAAWCGGVCLLFGIGFIVYGSRGYLKFLVKNHKRL